ncbi:uncharacterized protein LOC125046578 [Penaeus chinensis]|uniref:uncharacterized protein LOC125046578 n=1 Tax=Penaeus chinensis TaxID=139456 RepID=UPI001FB698D3|nr:uncharacterized protein LOC125046578 [Penaeus chinensis]XP_047500327.1 uncharacterized protein LOC125046578 [Penaeus chinensis]
MFVTRGLPVILVLVLLASLALEADAGRRRRLKRQHRSHDHEDNLRRARRREQRRARWRAQAEEAQEGPASANASAIPATPIRHHAPGSEGIRVGEAVDSPTCPPPATPFLPELCSAPACLHHQQCQQEHGKKEWDLACCFNGCVHTCLPPVGSPPVIDWLEDTGSLLPILEESAPPALPIRYEDEGGGGGGGAWAEGGAETVHLPGGCTISDAQYSQLQDFMKTPSIENCMCNKGEVVCAVKLFKT